MTLPEDRPTAKKKDEVKPGDIIAGRYKVVDFLAEGSMADVYIVRHLDTGREMALKLIKPEVLRKKPELTDMFLAEVKTTARLSEHPNVVPVTDASLDERRGRLFMVMPLLRGQTLRDFITTRLPPEGQWLPWKQLARPLLKQIASALGAAHALRIIHRDLKPSNIFIVKDHGEGPTARLLDFGIAKVLGPQVLTATIQGTPAYSAPEQLGAGVREIAAKHHNVVIARGVSAQTDVFAFGLVALEMLSGHGPTKHWGTRDPHELAFLVAFVPRPNVLEEHPHLKALLPPAFNGWLQRTLAHNAADRFASVADACEALCGVMDGFVQTQPDVPGVAGHVGHAFRAEATRPILPVGASVSVADTAPEPAAVAATVPDPMAQLAQTELLEAAVAATEAGAPASRPARPPLRTMIMGAVVGAVLAATATAGVMALGQTAATDDPPQAHHTAISGAPKAVPTSAPAPAPPPPSATAPQPQAPPSALHHAQRPPPPAKRPHTQQPPSPAKPPVARPPRPPAPTIEPPLMTRPPLPKNTNDVVEEALFP